MADDGWIAVSRALLHETHDLHPRSTGTPACELGAWIDLLGRVKWKAQGGLERAETRDSESFFADRWNWSKSKVHRFLVKLEEAGRIERVETPGPRTPNIIRICNYDVHQPDGGVNRERSAGRTASGAHGESRANRTPSRNGGGVDIPRIASEPHSESRAEHGANRERSEVEEEEQEEVSPPPAREAESGGEETTPTDPVDQSPDGVAELVERWPVAGEVLDAMEHHGGRASTVATLNSRFVYRDLSEALLPDASVKGRSHEARLELVAAALVEMRDQGKAGEWSAPLLSRFIQRVEREDRNPAPGSEAARWTAAREKEHYAGPTRGSTGVFSRPQLPTCPDCGNMLVREICPTCQPVQLVKPEAKGATA